MKRMLFVALILTGMFITGCGQEKASAPAQPKAEMKPAAEPAPPAPPAAPVAPAPPAEVAKPAAPAPEVPKVAEAPKAPEPSAAPAKSSAQAAPAPAKPAVKIPNAPDNLILPASQGQVSFPHLAHAKSFPCATCHGDGTPGKIDLTKDTAHALCRDCHKAKSKGPTACGECHKK